MTALDDLVSLLDLESIEVADATQPQSTAPTEVPSQIISITAADPRPRIQSGSSTTKLL